eukprot:TRINITY_DN7571_c0_g1_i1.p2 TRINITY_DN7571_c0_g1~~TRINITY_DN7571_c0_g1_i1.p2  ORF type:complete len:164 (+),score=49.72 TRINITY_DN7571_c0_g1_i1:77-568(+)
MNCFIYVFFFFDDTATTEIYTRSIVGSVRCVQETVSTQSTWGRSNMESKIGITVWMIRHGYSYFNSVKDAHKADPENVPYNKFDEKLLDPPLHEKGVLQCRTAQKEMNLKNIKYVFVSPLQRTLETAFYVFESHPMYSALIPCLLYTSPSPRDLSTSRMPSSA